MADTLLSVVGDDKILYTGTDGHLHELWYDVKIDDWRPCDHTATSAAPKPRPNQTVVKLVRAGSRFYVDTEDKVHEMWWSEDDHKWLQRCHHATTNATLAHPDAVLSVVGDDKILCTGTDGHLHEL